MVSNLNVFITSADGYTGHHLVRTLASDQYRRHFSTIYAGATDEKAVRDLRDLQKVKVVMYKPDEKQDLARHFKEADLVYMIPPSRRSQGRGNDNVDDSRRWEQDEALGEDRLVDASIHDANETVRRVRNMLEAAKEARVRNVGLWVPMGASEAKEHRIMKMFRELEREYERSGIENRCLIRVQLYMQSFLLYTRQVQERGELPLSTGRGKFAPFSLRDHSRFVACMIARKHGREEEDACNVDARRDPWDIPREYRNKEFNLTGPESLTGEEIAREATRAIGQGNTIRFKDISREETERILRRSEQLDRDEVRWMGEMYEVIKSGRLDRTTDDYKRAIGKNPTSVQNFFSDHQRDFTPRK